MNNEEKILQILTQIQGDVSELKTDVSELKTDVSELKTDVSELKQRVTRIEVTIETDIKKNIGLLADGHMLLNEKLDHLKGLNEQVIELKTDSSIHKAAITELVRKTAR